MYRFIFNVRFNLSTVLSLFRCSFVFLDKIERGFTGDTSNLIVNFVSTSLSELQTIRVQLNLEEML